MASKKTTTAGVTAAQTDKPLETAAADATDAQAVAVRQETLPATADDIDYSEFAGMGREETRAEDYAIPFLRIIQTNSPEVDESNAKFIPEAKAGMFHNTVTGQIYDGRVGLRAIPCLFRREFVEWKPRDAGGGFVKAYDVTDPIVATGKVPEGQRDLVLPNGNKLIETFYQYVLVETPDGEMFPAVMSFISTQIKKIRRWNSMIGQKRITLPNGKVIGDPPSFAFWYHISTVTEKNDKGSWRGLQVMGVDKAEERVAADVFREAMLFYKQIKAGEVKRAAEDHGADGREPGSDDEPIPGFDDNAQQTF